MILRFVRNDGGHIKNELNLHSEKGDPLTHVKSFYAHPPNVLKWLMMIVL